MQNSSLPLRNYVEQVLTEYFNKLDGHDPADLYDLVIKQIEAPLIKTTLKYTNNNQCKTAKILGLSRGTLRKKIREHCKLFSECTKLDKNFEQKMADEF